jgi:hypothetical protein
VISVVHSAIQRALRATVGLVVAAHIDQQRADQRQEGDDGEDGPSPSSLASPPNMNQVIKAATPISIAKA